MADYKFMVGDVFVMSQLVGRVQDLPKPGPVISVEVMAADEEAVNNRDLDKLKKVTIEVPYTGDLTKDLRKASFIVLEDLCAVRQDPEGYQEGLERRRTQALEKRGVPIHPEQLMSVKEFVAGMREWVKILGSSRLDQICELVDLENLL